MPKAQDDARMVAAQIVTTLRDHLRATPNKRGDGLVPEYKRNGISEGMLEAIEVIAREYNLDISNPDRVAVQF